MLILGGRNQSNGPRPDDARLTTGSKRLAIRLAATGAPSRSDPNLTPVQVASQQPSRSNGTTRGARVPACAER